MTATAMGHHAAQIEEQVIENFVVKREPFRAEHLKKAQEAYNRGDLVWLAHSEPVDQAF